jgi:hypothetical protein
MPTHEEAVGQIANAVRDLFQQRQPFRIFHGSTNSTRPIDETRKLVDISALSNILEINRETKTAIVEPGVSMDRLVQATLAVSMIPPVVMEFPGITVGGGYAGSAGESSSFKYGYFDHSVKAVEIVLATGDLMQASETTNVDLLKSAAGALGTLGITTKLEINLIPARRFVKLRYQPYQTVHDTITALRHATQDPENDYVDAILFSKSHGVLMIGRLTDVIPSSVRPQTFSGPWDPWFYLHVQQKPSDHASTEWIPIAEYLFRYDRGGFWVGAEAFKYSRFLPFNRLTRWLLNDFMHTRMLYRALHGGNMSFGHMIQDLSLPYSTVEQFIEYTSENLGIWPLWLCPLAATDPPTFHPCTTNPETGVSEAMLNVGVWGAASKDFSEFVRQNRDLETRLSELGGRKVLYSHTYYTEEEFWRIYNKNWYDELRNRYSATTLPTVYNKVAVHVEQQMRTRLSAVSRLATMWPVAGLVGMWCAFRSGDHLLHRDLAWMKWRLGVKED